MNLSADEEQIRQTIDHYCEGMRTSDAGVLKMAFHAEAILCGYLGDEMIAAPIQALYDWVGANTVADGYTCSVLGIEITGRVAAAKVRETEHDENTIDHFHLLKDGDRWWIVSKIWDAEPAAEQ